MKKNLLSILSVLLLVSSVKSQTTIAAARLAALYSTVVVKGVVLNGPEMGTIRYLQDNTGGIAAFSSSLSALSRGDSVQISGPLIEFRNLLEIATTTANPAPVTFTALGVGITQTPSVITTAQFNENVEGRLIKFIGCTFIASGTFSSGVNYTVNTGAGSFVARITSSVSSLFGSTIPTGTVDIVGIGSQFCTTPAAGCTSGYQLALRDINDITTSSIGVKEIYKEAIDLSVFPNPANNKINFKINQNDVIKTSTITDITGKVVYSSKENTTSADISGLNNGVYFIVVNTQAYTYRSKFVISR
jgi:hypothetical protein